MILSLVCVRGMRRLYNCAVYQLRRRPDEYCLHINHFRSLLLRTVRTRNQAGSSGPAFAITELDSVPGGIGLTAFLSKTYAALGFDVLGGAHGMMSGFHRILGDRAPPARVG